MCVEVWEAYSLIIKKILSEHKLHEIVSDCEVCVEV